MYQTFGRHTPIQRCPVHKARNILERLSKPLHAAVRAVLRQAWGLDDADNRIGYRRELLKYVLKGDGPLFKQERSRLVATVLLMGYPELSIALLKSKFQQRRDDAIAGQRQVAEARAKRVRDGVADCGDGGAAARFADAERGKVG